MRKALRIGHPRDGHGARHIHRFMDDVYREMFQLESRHPGAEMGLALALLRARVAADREPRKGSEWTWLKTVCPICLKMIEDSLNQGGTVRTITEPGCTSFKKN